MTAIVLSAFLLNPMVTSSTASGNVDWPHIGNTFNQQRFSGLSQINIHTIDKLGVAWTMDQGPNLALWEDDPVVVHGIMYVTTNTDQVIAVHADTGRRIWTYTPTVDLLSQLMLQGSVQPVNRGVEVAAGHVYLLTYDDQLISLNASTGKPEWHSVVADPKHYYEQSPPTYRQGLLLLGEAGIGSGVRGFVAAFDARTGKLRWRFYTVPAPGKGWMDPAGQTGGGDVWMAPTVDPTTGVVYVGTGNPTPDLDNTKRPGCDRWTDATLALDAKSGRLLWGRTQVCPDVWDYDSGQSPMLLSVQLKGRTVSAIGQGSKSGRYWLFNARTGATISLSPLLGKQTSPRPVPNAKGVKVCPGIFGGLEYSPPAYSSLTGLIYLPGVNLCTIDKTLPTGKGPKPSPGQVAFGGTTKVAPERPSGFLTALDPATGRIRWQVQMPAPLIGGALATAGGLVFSGSDNGRFYAFDARTGAIVWHSTVGLGFGAAPIAYMVNGVQYLAIAAGGSAVAPQTGAKVGGRRIVFRLAGQPVGCLLKSPTACDTSRR
jgi:alcohol dehydrogenase (cytochrome c)